MKQIIQKTKFTIFETISELPDQDRALMKEAIKARNNAYAPYSNFNVGAAVLLENKEIVLGNNQENAAYPSGLCAERIAVYAAASKFPNVTIAKIAISASSSMKNVDKPVAPCGACRQSIAEYEFKQDEDIELFFMGETGEVLKTDSLKNLLPFSFDNSFL